jgi:type III restriction enzyme
VSVAPDVRHALAPYQQKAVDAVSETLRTVSGLHTREPEHRTRIARELGVILLQAPTGSGKTLMLGRALEAVRGQLEAKTVWFWFARLCCTNRFRGFML